ncbi:MAG: hypothetical protein M0R38_06755 [Bacteroidia bacterium]|nr:hypothetical protein [Bacteroidia bacterium]
MRTQKQNKLILFVLILLMGIMTLPFSVLSQGEHTTLYKFKPNWKDGMEMVWFHKVTNMNTNERDMPIYMTIDSLYSVMNFSYSDSNTWIVSIRHFMKYDVPSKTAYLATVETLKNAPILLEFDSSFNYIGLQNWEQWRDTLQKNLRIEFEKKKIALKTYSEYRQLYEQPEEVENVVVNYYIQMFSIFGRSVNLGVLNPMVAEIKNPFKEREWLTKSGDEAFFSYGDNTNEIVRTFSAKSDKEDFQTLAEDYFNYLRQGSDIEISIPPPRIILERDEIHTYDIKMNNLKEYRMESSVNINGAKTLLEYRFILLNIRQ